MKCGRRPKREACAAVATDLSTISRRVLADLWRHNLVFFVSYLDQRLQVHEPTFFANEAQARTDTPFSLPAQASLTISCGTQEDVHVPVIRRSSAPSAISSSSVSYSSAHDIRSKDALMSRVFALPPPMPHLTSRRPPPVRVAR